MKLRNLLIIFTISIYCIAGHSAQFTRAETQKCFQSSSFSNLRRSGMKYLDDYDLLITQASDNSRIIITEYGSLTTGKTRGIGCDANQPIDLAQSGESSSGSFRNSDTIENLFLSRINQETDPDKIKEHYRNCRLSHIPSLRRQAQAKYNSLSRRTLSNEPAGGVE